jgi:hypothetical protein
MKYMVGHIHLNTSIQTFTHLNLNIKRLYNTPMMVIVHIYKEVNYFKYKQQGKVTFMPQITFLTHLYNLCTKEFVFPIFPLVD